MLCSLVNIFTPALENIGNCELYFLNFCVLIPYAKKCACNMHVTTNYMHVMVNMHVTLLLHDCYMHVVRVLEMVAHVPCMLYEC